MTYIQNLINAIKGKPYIQAVHVYSKDPRGLLKRDLAIIKQYSDTKLYKVGDSIESVAYKAGQADLLSMIETKLVKPKSTHLPRF